jgi:hypothetical protein
VTSVTRANSSTRVPPRTTRNNSTAREKPPKTVANARYSGADASEKMANARYTETSQASERVANARYQAPSTSERQPSRFQETVANARYTGGTETAKRERREVASRGGRGSGGSGERVANARYSPPGASASPGAQETVASARYGDYPGVTSRSGTSRDERQTRESVFGGPRRTDALDSTASGRVNPFKIAPSGYVDNMVMNVASGTQSRVGYMDMPGPNAMDHFSKKFLRALKGSNSVASAMSKIAGKPCESGLNERPLAWRAEKIGGENFKDSPFRISTDNKEAKNIFIGVSGWGPVSTFKRSMNKIADVMKEKFNASTMRLVNGKTAQIDKAFAKVAEYAKKNPNKPVNMMFYLTTHGNKTGGGGEGAAHGTTLNIDEKQLKGLYKKHFKGLKNVAIHQFISACHAGAYLA